MQLDLLSISVVTTIVVLMTGSMFIVETVIRKDTGAGMLWALGYLSGILTTFCYLAWVVAPAGGWVAIAVGNTAFAASAVFMWLGTRSFNGRSVGTSGASGAAACLAVLVVSLLPLYPEAEWAGVLVLYPVMAVFALLGGIESRRGVMGSTPSSWGLTIVLISEGLFFAGRSVAFVVLGPEHPFFVTWFGSIPVALLTVVLLIVAVVTTSVLRADRVGGRLGGRDGEVGLTEDGLLHGAWLARAIQQVVERAEHHGDRLAVIAVRLDDLPRIGTAFGPLEAEQVGRVWRASMRRNAPTSSFIGECDPACLVVVLEPTSVGDARRVASRLHRHMLDDLSRMGAAVIPVMGIGVALTDRIGYDARALVEGASDAARRSESSVDASVIIDGTG
ncbi:hypothetical protein M4I32_00315 [Microbacterium sp. LRZ72]|uniref:GGDEF domain-containing protein n=1 Tax=Microbacterium sp. LRZ72 TaxID=2942481 RepID=UPI0029B4D338|nr:hypothetical protein [Microbacterium sp. LRZ72]MDX2375247.1 hypothetical protein [Microbacterium sp. LRZ72]